MKVIIIMYIASITQKITFFEIASFGLGGQNSQSWMLRELWSFCKKIDSYEFYEYLYRFQRDKKIC